MSTTVPGKNARDARDRRMVAALLAGETRAQIAERFGVSYATAARATRGTGLKRSGPPRVDHSAVIEAARAEPNLMTVALLFDISRERVRQIVVRHERETGEVIPRVRRRDYARHPLRRVTVTCPGCGRVKTTSPRYARERCHACAVRMNSSHLSDVAIEDAISRHLAGVPWMRLAVELGYKLNGSAGLPRAVFTQLQRQGRTSEIAALWPRGIPRWLQRFAR